MSKKPTKDLGKWKSKIPKSDQIKGVPMPPIQKPVPKGKKIISLPEPPKALGKIDLKKAITARKSRRTFTEDSISQEDLSLLLWMTQGIRDPSNPNRIYRNVPSAGNRHALETYLAIFRADGIPKGIYRYLPIEHALVPVSKPAKLEQRISAACLGQKFIGEAAVTFIWSVLRYRMEWRYGPISIKILALDAGHVCQNLYLGCESIGCGTCAIAAYDQDAMDRLLGLDGEKEFTIYIAPVGRPKE
ncbi:MAG: SagB/ThcOx family dehydrogenase [Thermoplasmata archaeon]|nr:SagB/ThcOx family dehydrogenase [Thermoplasmata archaeon]